MLPRIVAVSFCRFNEKPTDCLISVVCFYLLYLFLYFLSCCCIWKYIVCSIKVQPLLLQSETFYVLQNAIFFSVTAKESLLKTVRSKSTCHKRTTAWIRYGKFPGSLISKQLANLLLINNKTVIITVRSVSHYM